MFMSAPFISLKIEEIIQFRILSSTGNSITTKQKDLTISDIKNLISKIFLHI